MKKSDETSVSSDKSTDVKPSSSTGKIDLLEIEDTPSTLS